MQELKKRNKSQIIDHEPSTTFVSLRVIVAIIL